MSGNSREGKLDIKASGYQVSLQKQGEKEWNEHNCYLRPYRAVYGNQYM